MKSWGGYRAAALSVAAIGMDMRGPHVGLRVVVCAFHILFAGTLVLASVAFAAAPSKSFHFEHLGVEQGLSQESVFAILQDHQGFLWFGTQAGLNRFDGYRVTVYKSDPKDDNSLADNWVGSLYEDDQKRLWVGTRGGLHRYDPGTEKFTRYALQVSDGAGAGNLDITAIASDGHGKLWVATSDGVFHFDPVSGRYMTYRHDAANADSLDNNKVRALVSGADGALWIGTVGGIDRMTADGKSVQHYRIGDQGGVDPKPNTVLALLIDRKNSLWLTTTDGLEVWTLSSGAPERRRFGSAEGIAPGQVNAVYQDREGNIWVGTETEGLKWWDAASGRFLAYRNQPQDIHSLASDRVVSLLQDRSGTLWIGTWFGGASRVDLASGGFERLVYAAGEGRSGSNNQVFRLTGNGKDKLWIATVSGGVSQVNLSSGAITSIPIGAPNPSSGVPERVAALWSDKSGRLWAGTAKALNLFDATSGRFLPVQFADNTLIEQMRSITGDRAGTLWIGSRGGIYHFDPVTRVVETYQNNPAKPDSLGNNWAESILEDRRGNLWVGTVTGLDRLDRKTGRFTHFRHDPNDPASLNHNRTHCLFEDRDGTVWVGTAGGLNRMELGADGAVRFHSYSSKDGMAADPIGGILQDDHGALWISTTAGITRFDPRNGHFKNYFARDGMVGGSYFVGSFYRGGDDTLYFGGVNGATAFQPQRIRDNPTPPAVVITDLLLLNQSVRGKALPEGVQLAASISEARELTLSPQHPVFSLEFAALHFADPQRNRFAYKLEGFDLDWINTDSAKRFAAYTNLEPGKYLFHVKAANKDGVWNEDGATLAITIMPPLWKTWWFRSVLAALLLGTAYAMYRYRIHNLAYQKRVLKQQVSERTTEVMLQKEEVEHQKESVELAHRNISLLSAMGRRITATLDSEAIMQTVYLNVTELMDADVFGVGFYRPEQNQMVSTFVMESGKRSLPYTRSMDDPNQLAVWCTTRQKEIFINDIDTELANYIDVAGLTKISLIRFDDGSVAQKPQSLIYMPMLVKDRVFGILSVQSFKKHAYEQVHLDMFRTLASYAAIALDNADAYRQLKDAQQQLVFQEKMASLGTLTAGVAHEINNPANFSHVGAQALGTDLEKFRQFLLALAGDDAEPEVLASLNRRIDALVEQAGTIVEGTTRIKNLVQDLRVFSRLDQAEKKAVPICDSLVSTVHLVRTQYAHTTQIYCKLEANPIIECWAAQLNQVFMNLIVNACQAIENRQKQSGDPRIGTLAIRSRIEDSHLLIEFEDDGCGIPKETIGRIFEPFYTTKNVGEGTGLGLSISFGIIEKHHGDIRVTSTIGEGTCFTLRLPLGDQGAAV